MDTLMRVKAINLQRWWANGIKASKSLRQRKATIAMRDFLANEFYRMEKRLFTSQGGAGAHGRWAALKKPRLGGRILVKTSRLKTSLTKRGGENILKARQSARGFKIDFGTRVPYAEHHQEGTDKMVKRRVLDPKTSSLNRIGRKLATHVERNLGSDKFFDKRGMTVKPSSRFLRFDSVRIF